MTPLWHLKLTRDLTAPVRAIAREQSMGVAETVEALLKFALARPEALKFYRDLEKNR